MEEPLESDSKLKNLSGSSWDNNLKMVVLDQEVADAYVKIVEL